MGAVSPIPVLILLASGLHAQTPARPKFEEFEVAAIKPAPPNSPGRFLRMQSPNQFVARNHSVNTLIAAAYNRNPRMISKSPGWADSERYDILAKTPGNVRPNLEEQMAMLRKLLAERFKLAFHRERRELPIFALTVARSGLKLKESAAPPESFPEGPPPLIFVVSPVVIRLPARCATVAELAWVMQRSALDHPVVDRTGLSARYDFDLEFTPDETVFGGALGKGTDESTKPGLFGALQEQLGLKVAATKGPVDVMIVDRVERPRED